MVGGLAREAAPASLRRCIARPTWRWEVVCGGVLLKIALTHSAAFGGVGGGTRDGFLAVHNLDEGGRHNIDKCKVSLWRLISNLIIPTNPLVEGLFLLVDLRPTS